MTKGPKLAVLLSADPGDLKKGLAVARGEIATFAREGAALTERLTRGLGGVKTLLGGLGAGISIAGLVNSLRQAISAADGLGKAATRIGVTTEALGRLRFAARLSGVEASTLDRTLAGLTARAPRLESEFTKLGITVRGAGGEFLTADEILANTADLLASLPEGAERTGLAVRLLGASGADLLPMLAGGSAGLRELGDEADRTGLIISRETAEAAAQFSDNLDRVRLSGEGVATQLAAELLPDLVTLSELLRDVAQGGDLARGIAAQLRIEWGTLAAAGREVAAAVGVVRAVAGGAQLSIRNAASTASFGLIDPADTAAVEGQADAFRSAVDAYKAAAEDFANAKVNALMAGAKFSGPDELRAQAEEERRLAELEQARLKRLQEMREAIDQVLARNRSSLRTTRDEADKLGPALARLTDITAGLAAEAGGPAAQAWERYRRSVQQAADAGAAAIKAGADEVLVQRQVAEAIDAAARIRDEALKRASDATTRWLEKLEDLQAELDGPVHRILLAYARDVREAAQAMEDGLIDEATFQRLVAAWTELRDRSIEAIRAPLTEAEQFQLGVAQAAVRSLAGLFASIGDSSMSASEKVKNFARGFAQAIASMIAEALAFAAVLRVLEAIAPGTAALLRASRGGGTGSFHSGGIVGMARGSLRELHPVLGMMAAAGQLQRFHSGGFPGLRANEIPAVLEKGEEVLAKGDPRNRLNGGGMERPAPGYRIVNVFDPSFVPDQMNSAAGEEVVMNHIGKNPGRVRQVLGL